MVQAEPKAFLQGHALFQLLTEAQRERLLAECDVREVAAGHAIIQDGQTEYDLYVLMEGMAKNTFQSDDGEEITVLFYHPGELIGLVSAIAHKETAFTVQAAAHCRLLRIPHATLNALLRENLDFSEQIMRLISQRFHALYREIREEHSYHATGLDTYPYRKKIGEIMTAPVLTATPDDSLIQLAKTMYEARVSSLVIVDGRGEPCGIVTREDIIHVVATCPEFLQLITAEDVMSETLITLPPEAFFYEALLLMAKHQIEHIPVVSGGRLEGMVTMRNLTVARGNAVLSVVDSLEAQTSVAGLAEAKKEIWRILESMLKDQATAHEMCSLITELNDRLVRKVIALAERELEAEGHGRPPVEYCWLAMGSEGRREQTLGTDQDNAIIYSDVPESERAAVDGYFSLLAEKVVAGLEQCGFPRCPGNVMATNPRWRNSVSGWKQAIQQWLEKMEGDELRSFTIFLDFRPVCGQTELAEEVRRYLLGLCRQDQFLLFRLTEDDAEHSVPLGLFGRIITERDREHHDDINLKHGGVMHIVNAMRILALREGIGAVSTLERLKALEEKALFAPSEAAEIRDAFQTLMRFRIREHLKQVKAGQAASNFLSVKSLDRHEYLQLKQALSTAKWLQQVIARRFPVGGRL